MNRYFIFHSFEKFEIGLYENGKIELGILKGRAIKKIKIQLGFLKQKVLAGYSKRKD